MKNLKVVREALAGLLCASMLFQSAGLSVLASEAPETVETEEIFGGGGGRN